MCGLNTPRLKQIEDEYRADMRRHKAKMEQIETAIDFNKRKFNSMGFWKICDRHELNEKIEKLETDLKIEARWNHSLYSIKYNREMHYRNSERGKLDILLHKKIARMLYFYALYKGEV